MLSHRVAGLPSCHFCSSMQWRTCTRAGPDEEYSPAQECRARLSAFCEWDWSLSLHDRHTCRQISGRDPHCIGL